LRTLKQTSDELSVALEALRNRPIVEESRDFAHQWGRSRARARSLVLATTGTIAVAGLIAFAILGPPELSTNQSARNELGTGVGETRQITLEDGSRIVLDTNSRVQVTFTADARDVQLLEGRAHFEVAKNVHRPFRVRTRSAEVIAVGTMFDVATVPARTTVTLIEGRVNVRTIAQIPLEPPKVEALVPGQQLQIADDGQFLDKVVVKLDNVTAWQRGTLVLDDMPLADALAAMNRYSNVQIVIPSESLQSRRVSGVFRVGDVETEVIVMQRYFGLKQTSRTDRSIVLDRN
jgi:transmembrane sensor